MCEARLLFVHRKAWGDRTNGQRPGRDLNSIVCYAVCMAVSFDDHLNSVPSIHIRHIHRQGNPGVWNGASPFVNLVRTAGFRTIGASSGYRDGTKQAPRESLRASLRDHRALQVKVFDVCCWPMLSKKAVFF